MDATKEHSKSNCTQVAKVVSYLSSMDNHGNGGLTRFECVLQVFECVC